MVPRVIRKEMKALIQKKALLESRQYYNENKREEAYYILKKLLNDYPDESASEEASYRLAEFYGEDMQYQKAIFFLDRVLANAYPDFDAPALFKKGNFIGPLWIGSVKSKKIVARKFPKLFLKRGSGRPK